MDSSSAHPTESRLIAFNQGQLEEAEVRAVGAHLDDCPACCDRLRDLSSSDPLLAWIRQTSSPATDRSCDRPEATPAADERGPDDRTPSPPAWLGDYEILGEVGRGGMGVVYKARHRKLRRLAAVKTILAPEHASTEQRVRFRREAELAAQIRHPHVVQVYEVGTCNGSPFLAMEWVEGGTLARRLRGEAMPPVDAARLAEVLANAVHAAHDQGVLHRDLKPANILVAEDGTPKVSDFGLARPLLNELGLTRSGTILGTPEYMAPEQASGRGAVGRAADVYSLGAILYELLTGRPPFHAPTPLETLRHAAEREPAAPRALNGGVPRDLEVICLKCLEKEPGRRYATSAELADDLRRWRGGESILARPAGPVERLGRWCRRNLALAVLLAVAGLLLLLAVAGTSWGWWTAEIRRQDAEEQRRLVERREREVEEQRDATARELANARQNLFTAHLNQIDVLHRSEPLAALALLRSDDFCPPNLRDAAWGFYERACSRWRPDELWYGAARSKAPRNFTRVNAVAFSPDGRSFVAGGHDGVVRVWDDATRRVVRTLEGHEGIVWDVCFNRDGSLLATASQDGTAGLWDAATGKRLHVFRHKTRVNTVRFSPDGRTLATGDHEFAAKLWDVPASGAATGRSDRPRVTFPVQNAWISAVRFNPAGTVLASASGNGVVCLWDLVGGNPANGPVKPRAVLRHPKEVSTIAFSPDGRLLAAGSHDVPVKLWDVAAGAAHATFEQAEYRPKSVVFSPDGQTLATGDEATRVRLWNVPTRQLRLTLPNYADDVNSVAFHPDGRRLISGGKNGDIELWDVSGDASLLTFEGRGRGDRDSFHFSPDGKTLAWAQNDQSVLLLDVESELSRRPSPRPVGAEGAGGKGRRVLPGPGGLPAPGGSVDEMGIAGFLPDGQSLVTYDRTGVSLRDLKTGLSRGLLPELSEPTTQAALSADGKYLATSSVGRPGDERVVRLWEATTGRLCETFPCLNSFLYFLFSPDGAALALVGRDGVTLWDLDGKSSHRLEAVLGKTRAAWSPDGQTLALRCHRQLVLLDLASGRLRTMRDDAEREPLAFCRDGTLAMSRHRDIQLWHVPRMQLRATIRGHAALMSGLTFDPAGERLASVSQDGVLKVWDILTPTQPISIQPITPGESAP